MRSLRAYACHINYGETVVDFESSAPSVSMFLQYTSRLASVISWVALLAVHSLLLSLLIAGLWVLQVSPLGLLGAAESIATSKWTALAMLLFGGSVVGVWLYGMKKLARAIHSSIGKHVAR